MILGECGLRQPASSPRPTKLDNFENLNFYLSDEKCQRARPSDDWTGHPPDQMNAFAWASPPASISVALKQQAIPHAAIPDCTNHFSLVNTLWKSEFDSACSIEGFQLFGGEFQIQTGEIILELRYLSRSYDRDYWHRS